MVFCGQQRNRPWSVNARVYPAVGILTYIPQIVRPTGKIVIRFSTSATPMVGALAAQ
jgi:hypothetical protein